MRLSKRIVTLVALVAASLATAVSSPVRADDQAVDYEVGKALICDTQAQAERFVALFHGDAPAAIGFVNAEINWALSFLPPLPPLPFAATQVTTLKTAQVAAEPAAEPVTETAATEKRDANVAGSVESTTKDTKDAPVAKTTPKSTDSVTGISGT